jgi:hypothetical protein
VRLRQFARRVLPSSQSLIAWRAVAVLHRRAPSCPAPCCSGLQTVLRDARAMLKNETNFTSKSNHYRNKGASSSKQPSNCPMTSEHSPGRRPRRSIENFDPSNSAEPILNSPRSVEACRRGGILAQDLVFRYADSFGDKFVSEEIKEMRARHYEEMRVMKLNIVKDEFLKASCMNYQHDAALSDAVARCAMRSAALRGTERVAPSILTRARPWRGSSGLLTPCGLVAKQNLIRW